MKAVGLEKYLNPERRIVWAIWVLLMVVAFVRPFGFPVRVSEMVQAGHAALEALPTGSIVYSRAIGLGSYMDGNQYPPQLALQNHLFKLVAAKGIKIVYSSAESLGHISMEFYIGKKQIEVGGAKYGVDYVILGPLLGGEPSYLGFYANIWEQVRGVDMYGTPLSQFPWMAEIRSARDFDFAVVQTGSPVELEITLRQLQTTYNIRMITTGADAMAGESRPHVAAGKIVAAVTGAARAAEYERLTGVRKQGSALQDTFAISVIFFTVMVVMSNASALVTKTSRRK